MKKTLFLALSVALVLFGTVLAPSVVRAAATPSSNATNGFVPLTQIPAIRDIASTNGLPAFFDNLYKYCVGAASALALGMIMFGGVTWMMAGDNTESIGKAKKYIQNALFGLLLVLSPAIVFSIINPNVLSLQIAFNKLAPSNTNTSTTAKVGTPSNPTPSTIDSTGAVNGACKSMPDGTIIPTTGGSAQNLAEQCCVRQTANGKKCTIGSRYDSNLNQVEFCSCS